MKSTYKSLLLITLPLTTLGCLTFLSSATAQITPDTSLGAESSVVTPNVEIKGTPSDRIDGGAVRGNNLFHSFSDFNINSGRGAYFSNPSGIANILSRVTGGNPSNIGGSLGVLGNANLFFANPNGVIFGPNARLDVAGSFSASTADSFMFDNGFEFSASNPQAPPLLTVNIPVGLRFRENPGNITNTGTLTAGQDLTLAGGNLDLQGQVYAGRDLTLQAQDTVKIRDNVTNPFIAAAGNQMLIQGNQGVDIFALNHGNSGFFSGGDMVLRSANPVSTDAHFWTGGNFRIENLNGDFGKLFSLYDPVIRARGDVSFNGYQGPSLHILAGGSVTISDYVNITGEDPVYGLVENVPLSNGIKVNIDGRNQPTLDIRAGTIAFGNPEVLPSSFTVPRTEQPSSANITIGNITNKGGTVLITNQYQPNPNFEGIPGKSTLTVGNIDTSGEVININAGKGGDITLTSSGNIITGNINSVPEFRAYSRADEGGKITLIAGNNLDVKGNIQSYSSAGTRAGRGGEISLFAGNNLDVKGNIQSLTQGNTANDGGAITLTANKGDINIAENIESFSRSETWTSDNVGNGGKIEFKAGNNITIQGNINSSSLSRLGSDDSPSGNAGEVILTADDGSINIKGNIESNSTARSGRLGNGGNITLTANKDVIAGNISSTSSDVLTGRPRQGEAAITGTGGAITLSASNGKIQTGNINSSSEAAQIKGGDGGTIILTAKKNLTTGNINSSASVFGLKSPGAFRITAELDPQDIRGNGGEIKLNTEGEISVGDLDARGKDGGNITITNQAGKLTLNNIIIDSSTTGGTLGQEETGKGGNIRFQAPSIELTNIEVKTTAINAGNAGNIFVDSPGSFVLNRSRLFTALEPGAEGIGGKITINAPQVDLTNLSLIDTATFGTGNAGELTIRTDNLSLNNSSILSISVGDGNAGKITISGNKNDVSNVVSLANQSNISTAVNLGAVGDGGEVKIDSRSLSLTSGSQISALTRGTGKSGNIQLNLGDALNISGIGTDGFVSGVFTSSEANNSGKGGDIFVNNTTGKLNVSISDGGVLSAQTFSTADGGNITLNANTFKLSNGGQLLTSTLKDSETDGKGGKAGSITVNATEKVVISDIDHKFANRVPPPPRPKITPPSTLAEVEPNDSIAQAQLLSDNDFSINSPNNFNQNVELATSIPYVSIEGTGNDTVDYYSFNVKEGTRAIFDIDEGATTGVQGEGNVRLELILFDSQGNKLASNSIASPFSGADGSKSQDDPYLRYVFPEAGRYFIQVKEPSFLGSGNEIRNGATYKLQISLGSPNIRGSVVNTSPESGLFARTQGTGDAGFIKVNTPSLTVEKGAQISTSTSNSGKAGDINLIVRDTINLTGTGTGIFANTEIGSTGKGGSITIDPERINIRDGAKIAVDSQGEGIGGNIKLAAGLLNLDRGTVSAETASNTGGNINLNINDLLLMRRGSLISATAGTEGAGGDGGNITINGKNAFIIGFPKENSDIIANAFKGKGGEVNINVYSTFGFVKLSRAELAKLSRELNPRDLPTNDITAISKDPDVNNQGEVNVNTLQEFQPTEVPEVTVIDPRQQIAQNPCQQGVGSEFVVTGRGGLPPTPTQTTRSETVQVDLVKPAPQPNRGNSKKERIRSSREEKQTTSSSSATKQIVPAQGWVFKHNGEVVLTAHNSNNTVTLRSRRTPGICSGR